MKYKQLKDLTSDVLFEVYGKDLKELFENSAEAVFSLMCKMELVKPTDETEVWVEGKDEEDLLFNWLESLIGQVDVDERFYSKFVIESIDGKKMKARIYGESISPEKGNVVVKSVTLYKFKLEKKEEGYVARFSLDI